MPIPHHLPSLFSRYNSARARQILRKSANSHVRCYAVAAARPYTFHIGASWAGKTEDPVIAATKVPFPSDTLIGSWRNKMLSRPKHVRSKDAGEDFFFVQELSISLDAPTRSLS
ncbi:hypothetical protein CC2G_005650 [Coprinopsis cinerea AmutBmut pab1-1]|nr:hypothetical protein CC2G_005650 [Coprinopsis cinerea AmutBmut pab1-1]